MSMERGNQPETLCCTPVSGLPSLSAASFFRSGRCQASCRPHACRRIRGVWDRETERAYVELRARDDDGGESIVTAIFSYRATSRISKHELKQDIVRKARYMFKSAGVAT